MLYSEFFRSRNLLETAWYGATDVTFELIQCLMHDGVISGTDPLARACDLAYERLFQSSCSEYVYKNVLLSKLVFGRYSPTTTSWLYEFRVGEARVDAVLVNGVATAFEIKTDLDDFSRARGQLDAYYSCFDRVFFVVGRKQVERALSELPDYVGILSLSKRCQLSNIREASSYIRELSSEAMFHLFRKDERLEIEKKYNINAENQDPVHRYTTALNVISKLPPLVVHAEFVEAIRKREPATKRAVIADQLPDSLRAAAFGYKMRRSDWALLAARLREPVLKILEKKLS